MAVLVMLVVLVSIVRLSEIDKLDRIGHIFSTLSTSNWIPAALLQPILHPFCFPRRLVLSCSRLPMENQSSLRPKVERAADLTSMPPNATKLDKKTFRCSKQDAHNFNTSSRSALLLSGNGYVSFGLAITE